MDAKLEGCKMLDAQQYHDTYYAFYVGKYPSGNTRIVLVTKFFDGRVSTEDWTLDPDHALPSNNVAAMGRDNREILDFDRFVARNFIADDMVQIGYHGGQPCFVNGWRVKI